MSIQALAQKLPDYAKDLKLNLTSLAGEEVLSPVQKLGTMLASALAAREPETIAAIAAEAQAVLPPEAFEAAKAAAAIMAMNNIYYRFTHLAGTEEYRALPARLRMNVIGRPGVPKADFELWSLAVSAVNGCGMCIEAHERELRKAGVGIEQIQAAARLAAVVHGVAATLEGERALGAGAERAAA
jgi:alkyl hydroperoxide reductase subunit D